MSRRVYIKGRSALSPQHSFGSKSITGETIYAEENRLRCIEPKYTDYLNPVMARRMGRIVKMGIATAVESLNDANVQMPDAIITGTALGCLGDTEKFLTAVIKDDEQFLTPTWFIQSLQNTVAAQIALHLKCMNHNFTFVHKGFSFESALLDGIMLLRDGEAVNVLAGGLDEMTDHNFHIYGRLNKWKNDPIDSSSLLNHYELSGTIAGEGSAFFVLSSDKTDVELGAVELINSEDEGEVTNRVRQFLSKQNGVSPGSTLVLYGLNGDIENDRIYHALSENVLKDFGAGYFKHLCGEYQTSSSFAMWLACSILEKGQADKILSIPGKKFTTGPEQVLVVNHYENNFSIIALRKTAD